MNRLRFLVVLTFAAITAPPSVASPTSPAAQADDARLSRPVSVHYIGTDLGRLAALLTKQTGVRIHVANDIADERLNVFVTDYPLGRLQRNLADLFGYKWSLEPSDDGPPAYLFWADAAARKRPEALRQRKTARKLEILREEVAHIQRLLQMPAAEVAKLPPDERDFAALVRREPFYRYLTGLNSTALKSLATDLFTEKHVESIAGLPAKSPIREMLARCTGKYAKVINEDGSTVLEDLPASAGPSGYTEVHIQMLQSWASGEFFDPLRGESQNQVISVEFAPPRTPQEVVAACEYMRYPLNVAALKMKPIALDARLLREYAPGFHAADAPEDLSDPRLAKAIKPAKLVERYEERSEFVLVQDFGENMNASLYRIALSSGVPVVSDFYAQSVGELSLKGLTCAKAVRTAAEGFSLQWDFRDGALLFRHNDWPRMMLCQIPLRTLDQLDALASDEGPPPNARCYNLDDPRSFAGLEKLRVHQSGMGRYKDLTFRQSLFAGTLPDEQRRLLTDYGYWSDWMYGQQATTLVCFLATLTPEQLQQAQTEKGLDAATLSEPSREAFSTFYDIRWTNAGYAPDVKSFRIRRVQSEDGGSETVSVDMKIVLPKEEKVSTLGLRFPKDKVQASGGK